MKLIALKPLSPEWFDYRRKRITGTDVPGILGMSKYKSALSVWCKITGKTVDEREQNELMVWGNRLEGLCREWTADEVPCVIKPMAEIAQHDELDWFCCTPDGLIQEFARGTAHYEPKGTWEGKATSPYHKDEWSEGMPKQHQVQVLAALAVTGLDYGILSVLFYPDPPRWGRIERNDVLVDRMLNKLTDFWEKNVLKDIPPPAGEIDEDTRILKTLHPEDSGEVVPMDDEDIRAATRRALYLAQQIKELKQESDGLRNRIRQWMRKASYAADPDGGGWSYCKNKNGNRVLTHVNRIPGVKT